MLLLHVSDIHFRAPNCLNPDLDPDRPYRTLMLRDIRSRVQQLGPVGAILIGGDIAFRGSAQEYQTARDWIAELASAADCPVERIFMVPGNHDVDRTIITRRPAVRNAQAAIAGADADRREQEFRTQILDGDTAGSLLAPLAVYNDFAKRFNCQVYLPDRLYWKQDLDLEEGVVLRLHGLTSTLLSGANGLDDTRATLYLSPLQTAFEPLDDVVNLALCHHPPDWLMDQDDVDEKICARTAIQMFGHKHRSRITRDTAYVRFNAAAVNPDRNEPGWLPGYNMVDVRVTGGVGERALTIAAHLRHLQFNPEQFRATVTSDGEEVFRHSIRLPNRQHADAPATILTNSVPRGARTSAATQGVVTGGCGQGPDVEATMGNTGTRNLVFRFWNLTSSQRRKIMLRLQLISQHEIRLPEAERYGRGLIRAGQRDQLADLEREVTREESTQWPT